MIALHLLLYDAYQIHFFCKHRTTVRTNINMYRALVVSLLLYGSDSWSTTLADHRRLDVFDMRCHRRVLRVFWQEHIGKQSIHERTQEATASYLLRQRLIRWLGHIPSFRPFSLYE